MWFETHTNWKNKAVSRVNQFLCELWDLASEHEKDKTIALFHWPHLLDYEFQMASLENSTCIRENKAQQNVNIIKVNINSWSCMTNEPFYYNLKWNILLLHWSIFINPEITHNLICFQKLVEFAVPRLYEIGFDLVVKDGVKRRKLRLYTKWIWINKLKHVKDLLCFQPWHPSTLLLFHLRCRCYICKPQSNRLIMTLRLYRMNFQLRSCCLNWL